MHLPLLGSLHAIMCAQCFFDSSFVIDHKSKFLRKVFSGREDFHPYLMYSLKGRSLFFILFPFFHIYNMNLTGMQQF